MTTVFPKQKIDNTLGEWVAAHGLTQFRVAETEKYPHVTFFLNGGTEDARPRRRPRTCRRRPRSRPMTCSPRCPPPRSPTISWRRSSKGYDLIVVNYANPDMVGHTGDLQAAIKACEAVDQGLGRVLAALETAGGAMIVTADHGNCETMVDPVTGGPHTAHTTNPVPVILVGGPPGVHLRATAASPISRPRSSTSWACPNRPR